MLSKMTNKKMGRVVLMCLAATIFFSGKARESEAAAVICSPGELDPCIPPMATPTAAPPGICCRKLREQRQCFCTHLMDPNLALVINSPGARRVAANCGVLFPDCYLL